jgi:hypothetical protein
VLGADATTGGGTVLGKERERSGLDERRSHFRRGYGLRGRRSRRRGCCFRSDRDAAALQGAHRLAFEPRERSFCGRAVHGNERRFELTDERFHATTGRSAGRAQETHRRRARAEKQGVEHRTQVALGERAVRCTSTRDANTAVLEEKHIVRLDAARRRGHLIRGREHQIAHALGAERNRTHFGAGKHFCHRNVHALPPRTSTPRDPR